MKYILLLLLNLPIVTVAAEVSDYKLGTGDYIRIQVFGEEDLNLEVRLSDAGTISYPFLGEIEVLGLTVGQLEGRITEGLKGDYLIDPRVNLAVIEYRNFYIHGEVENPGGYSFLPGLTLRKAVALAGGFTERASRSKIYVLHEDDINRNKPATMALGATVYPGDIITIEQSFF